MRQVSIFPFLTGILLSSILILLLYIVRKRRFFILQFGVSSIALVYLLCVGRMLLPFEFPFTKVVDAEFALNPVIDILYTETMRIGAYPISIVELLIFVWICVSMVLLVRFVKKYWSAYKQTVMLPKQNVKHLQAVMDQIQKEKKRSIPVKVLCCREVSSPFSIGLVKKQILLPVRDYSRDEVYYILLHEYTHFMNHDLMVKMIVHIFTCVFWWNPVVYLLQNDLEQILEMKCDVTVTASMEKEEKADYLKVMLSELLKETDTKRIVSFPNTTASFLGQKDQISIEERFRYVKAYPNKKKGEVYPNLWSLV